MTTENKVPRYKKKEKVARKLTETLYRKTDTGFELVTNLTQSILPIPITLSHHQTNLLLTPMLQDDLIRQLGLSVSISQRLTPMQRRDNPYPNKVSLLHRTLREPSF